MTNLAPFTPDTLRTIRRNAGKVPVEQLARDCGISPDFLERVARQHGIDLRLRTAPQDDPSYQPSAAGLRAHRPRDAQITIHLDQAVLDEVAAVGAGVGISRNTAIRRLVENAYAKYLIEGLVRLPAPAPSRRGGDAP